MNSQTPLEVEKEHLYQQLSEIEEIFRTFIAENNLDTGLENHLCALQVIHNFIKRLRERVTNRIEAITREMNQ